MTSSARFTGREQPAPSLVQNRLKRLEASLDGSDVDHQVRIDAPANTSRPILDSFVAFLPPARFFSSDSVALAQVLSPAEFARVDHRSKLTFLRALARSLETLHMQKIVHGDLKPPNILITRPFKDVVAHKLNEILSPKIIDFDGAFFDSERPDPEDITFDQHYVAPEMLTFSRGSQAVRPLFGVEIGTPADIFSLGVLIHEYWTGHRPSLPAGIDYAATAVLAERTLMFRTHDLHPALHAAMRTALVAEPRLRPSAHDISAAIEQAIRDVGTSPGRSTPTVSYPPSPVISPTTAATQGGAQPPPPLRPLMSKPGVVVRKPRNLKRDKDD